jgi:hypothetical protein
LQQAIVEWASVVEDWSGLTMHSVAMGLESWLLMEELSQKDTETSQNTQHRSISERTGQF